MNKNDFIYTDFNVFSTFRYSVQSFLVTKEHV